VGAPVAVTAAAEVVVAEGAEVAEVPVAAPAVATTEADWPVAEPASGP
jgi:hypothetical protein